MYGRSFEDIDGHIWESMFVDRSRSQAVAEGLVSALPEMHS
jgi:hypothetical protein